VECASPTSSRLPEASWAYPGGFRAPPSISATLLSPPAPSRESSSFWKRGSSARTVFFASPNRPTSAGWRRLIRCGSISACTHLIEPGGKEFHVRKRRTDHQKRIAAFKGILGGLGAKKANAAGCIWTVVRYGSFTQMRLDDRRTEHQGNLFQFLVAWSASWPARTANLLHAIQRIGGMLKLDPRGNLIAIGWDRRGVMDRILIRAALLNLLYLNIDRNCDVNQDNGGFRASRGSEQYQVIGCSIANLEFRLEFGELPTTFPTARFAATREQKVEGSPPGSGPP
jgi:hypothetical protein